MTAWLLFSTWLWPVLLATLAPQGRFWWTPAVGALPALAAAVLVPVGTRLELPWLLLGTVIGLDATGRAFLLFTAILWFAAGLYAAQSFRGTLAAGRFRTLFLVAMAGNLWLIVGQDLVSFYVGFASMGLAAYGLVIHNGDAEALRAGRVYVVMTIVGEVALFVAFVLIAHHSSSLTPTAQQLTGLGNPAIALLVIGLGIKAGIVPLHVWLPLAHPAAPVPASAVLSGTMIKVALLGWIRFLPLGTAAVPDWGALLIIAGISTILFAIPVGLTQREPKVVLAYSSVSKMGFLVMGLGLILIEPILAPAGIAALTLYAAHHALVKGGLFLGVGLRKHATAGVWVVVGLNFLALAMAGAPLTSGAVAKYGVKPLVAKLSSSWLMAAMTLSTVGTTLLMSRFLWVAWSTKPQPACGYIWGGGAWAVLVMLVLIFPFVFGSSASWATNAKPVVIGLSVALLFSLIAWLKPRLLKPLIGLVPPGDILYLGRALRLALGWLADALRHSSNALLRGTSGRLGTVLAVPEKASSEQWLRQWNVAGVLWGSVFALLLMALIDRHFVWTRSEAQLERKGASLSPEEPVTPLPPADTRAERAQVPPSGSGENRHGAEMTALTPGRDRAAPPVGGTEGIADLEGVRDADADSPAREDLRPQAVPVGPLATPPLGMVLSAPPRTASAQNPSGGHEAALAGRNGEPERRDCEPTPYVFRYVGEVEPGSRIDLQINLVRCETADDGSRRVHDDPVLSNRLVEAVQRSLQDLGLDPGSPDGLIGPITRGAIRRFQIDYAMAPDGLITFRLLDRIQRALAERSRQPDADHE